MFKIILGAGLISLLAACSSMPGGSTTSRGGMSNSSTMGATTGVDSMGMGGYGPRGSSGGGPN